MVRNPDPKPGRWILPLVVLGMVLFTWGFVQRLQPNVIADDTPLTAPTTAPPEEAGEEPSSETTGPSTTPTTLPDDLAAFLAEIVSDQEALAVLANELDAVNDAWDNDEISYGDAEAKILELRDEAADFRDRVVLRQPPAGYAEVAAGFEDALNAADTIAATADAVLDGLRSSDTGQARRSAMLEFRSAVETFNQAVEAMQSAAQASAG